jgi:hypothetical protein
MILTIHDPVYAQDVLVAIGEESESKIIRAAIRAGYGIPDIGAMTEMLEMPDAAFANVGDRGTGVVIIRLRQLRRHRAEDVSTLTHECVHAATMLFDRIGFPLKAKTDEPLAYYVAFLVRSVLEKMK